MSDSYFINSKMQILEMLDSNAIIDRVLIKNLSSDTNVIYARQSEANITDLEIDTVNSSSFDFLISQMSKVLVSNLNATSINKFGHFKDSELVLNDSLFMNAL